MVKAKSPRSLVRRSVAQVAVGHRVVIDDRNADPLAYVGRRNHLKLVACRQLAPTLRKVL
jgi:hypothetical protein